MAAARCGAEDHIREAMGRDGRGEAGRALQTVYCRSFALSELRVASGCQPEDVIIWLCSRVQRTAKGGPLRWQLFSYWCNMVEEARNRV